MTVDWDFFDRNRNIDPVRLRLKHLGNKSISPEEKCIIDFSIQQIECRNRNANKFPGLWEKYPRFIFPNQLAGEQATHLWVALLHAQIAKDALTRFHHSLHVNADLNLLDMTAGLGLDFICLSSVLTKNGKDAVAVEMDSLKASVLKENLKTVGLSDAKVLNDDSINVLNSLKNKSVKFLFADPARRTLENTRIYNPKDCQPDIVGFWTNILEKAGIIFVKNSSMLDLHQALELFPGTMEIYVTSVKGECKEVMLVASQNGKFDKIKCINILGTDSKGELMLSEVDIPSDEWLLNPSTCLFIDNESDISPGTYLYETNASVMKAMPWSFLSNKFNTLKKFSPNCHLFISEEYYPDFPGRILQVNGILSRSERKRIRGENFNVVTRNYPERAEALSNALKLKSDKDNFLYGATIGVNEHPIILTAKRI